MVYRRVVIEIRSDDEMSIEDAIGMLEEHVDEIADETDTELTVRTSEPD